MGTFPFRVFPGWRCMCPHHSHHRFLLEALEKTHPTMVGYVPTLVGTGLQMCTLDGREKKNPKRKDLDGSKVDLIHRQAM